MYAGPLSRKCNCAREHNPKANLCLSGQALRELLWHQLKDKLQRHHKWRGNQEGSSVLDSNWCGKRPKVLGEGSPAFHLRELFVSKSSNLTLMYGLSSANLADPPLEVQSALGESFDHGVPTRGCVGNVKQFQKKHLYIGRGGTRGRRSVWANPFSVSAYGRQEAIARFERYLRSNSELLLQLPSLRHRVLLCHCKPHQGCHADILIKLFQETQAARLRESPPAAQDLQCAAAGKDHVAVEESDTEPDEGAPPLGSGWLGHGPPLQVGQGPKQRGIRDGAGLCSPGRWAPRHRQLPETAVIKAVHCEICQFCDRYITPKLFSELACGKHDKSPFPKTDIDSLRQKIKVVLLSEGHDGKRQVGDRGAVEFRLVTALLQAAGDPDAEIFGTYPSGVRIGVGQKLPRTPAVFERKTAWRLESQADPGVHLWGPATVGAANENYKSARELSEAVERELQASVEKGHALAMSEAAARDRFGEALVLASLGAQVKDDSGPQVVVRVLFDGTHGVSVNSRIRVRDQVRTPAAPDVKRYLRQISQQTAPPLGFKIDVKDAHRLIPVDERDWHLLGCRSREGGPVFINTTGTFGVSSAAYWWGRLAGAVIRLCHYYAGSRFPMWLPLVADDLLAFSAGQFIRASLSFVLVLFLVVGLPLSWKKIEGGESMSWVGYEVLLREAKLGVTEKRALWLGSRYSKLLEEKVVKVGRFQEGLGRAAFVCSALEYDRPFLAPLYTFASLYDPEATRPLPLYVLATLQFLKGQLARRRHIGCAVEETAWSEAWRESGRQGFFFTLVFLCFFPPLLFFLLVLQKHSSFIHVSSKS